MKLIKQSFEILPEREDPIQQIAERARICYKSEDQAKEDETVFVKGLIKHGHNSCLEMFVEHLFIPNEAFSKIMSSLEGYLSIRRSKYLICTLMEGEDAPKGLLVTGSIRAFREFIITNINELPNLCKMLLHYFLNHPNEEGERNGISYWHLFSDIQESSKGNYYLVNLKFDETTPADIMFKHEHVAVKFITNRAVTHELVRHRPLAFLQESQRYCRYSDEKFGNEVTFIEPTAFERLNSGVNRIIWEAAIKDAESYYLALLRGDLSPQAARTVLPNSCKTEIIAYASLREWSHIFAMRTSHKAEPSMQEAMFPVWEKFKEMFPNIPEIQEPEKSVG